MSASVHIPVKEYLRTAYRPDCDYVDGEVQEWNLGEQTHNSMQSTLAILFGMWEEEQGLRVLTEQRVQVSASRYRIQDVCLVRDSNPVEQILLTPPVLCIEMLAPEDRIQRVHQRVREYRQTGLPMCGSSIRRCGRPGSRTTEATCGRWSGDLLRVPGTAAELTRKQVFARIDRAQRA